MKSKHFLGLLAATTMLLTTSCLNDELDVVQSGNEAQVTFSLGLEGNLATRAISDGANADKLVYAVYKLNAENVAELQHVVGTDENGQFVKNDFKSGDNVSITLAKGQTYQVAFWAQDGDAKAFDTDALNAVKVDYNEATNNDELRDAFFKTVEFEVNGDKSLDVVLKRPFAQVNVGVTQEDWAAAVASGIEIKESSVIIKNVANELNLLTGAVDGNVEITYAANAIPDETLYVETDSAKEGKEAYEWLSMSYILVNDKEEGASERTTLEELEYSFIPKNGKAIVFVEGLNSVPVQRNWRTNILGKILTGDVQFNVTVDPVYDGDINFPEDSGTFADLEMAASFGGTVTLDESIAMPAERPFLEVTSDFVLNIEDGVEFTTGDAANYGIIVAAGTTEINSDGAIKSQGGGIGVKNGAEVIYNGGNLDVNSTSTSGRYLFYLEGKGSSLTINDGNFDFNRTPNQKRAYIYAGAETTVYVKGGTFGKASSRVDYKDGIYGEGTVLITGGTFGFDPTAWVAEGYKAEKDGDVWVVTSGGVKFVDLGLSVLWADRNVKAESETEIGQYYSWADTTDPEPLNENGIIKISWNWDNYAHYRGDGNDDETSMAEINKYNAGDGETRIQPEDDIAFMEYGTGCHIPTMDQINELREKCDWTWDDTNKGCKVTGPNGNSIFIPAGGYFRKTNEDNTHGTHCCIWSSDIDETNLLQALYLESKYAGKETSSYLRHLGMPIRAVKVK